MLPSQVVMQLTHRDIWLDFFITRQHLIKQLNTGDKLDVGEDCCFNSKGRQVLRFSKHFINKIDYMKQKGYLLKTAKIRFVIYWHKENDENEIRIILPELYFERKADST